MTGRSLQSSFILGVILSLGGVFFTVLLKIAEGLVSQQISIASVAAVPDVGAFLFDEYFHIGLDLLVVSFSFIVGVAISLWKDSESIKRLLVPVLFMVLACVVTLIAKGISDQLVYNYQSRIMDKVVSSYESDKDKNKPILVSFTPVERYMAIQQSCRNANSTLRNGDTDLLSVCEQYRSSKNWQIWSPIVFALLSLGLAVWGVSRQDSNQTKGTTPVGEGR